MLWIAGWVGLLVLASFAALPARAQGVAPPPQQPQQQPKQSARQAPEALPSIDDLDALGADGTAALEAAYRRLLPLPGVEPAWRAAYACFLIADDPSMRGGPRSDWARRGLDLAEKVRAAAPARPEGHYVYALNLGAYLSEHRLQGLRRVGDLIAAADEVNRLDDTFARGGGHRILAILYATAPSIIGPGDSEKALKHLARLLEIAPAYPPNRTAAARTYIELGDDKAARKEIALAKELVPRQTLREKLRRSWLRGVAEVERRL
jgi:tetratricopeptide (TPR) repeat protein